MIETIPYTREIVLVGGGHTHALILRRWGMAPLPGARLTVINPAATAPYTGMLPGFVAGHYARDDLEIDILRLARFAGARMIFGLVDGIDAQAKTVSMASRPPIPYHILSLDIGITSTMPDLPGFSEHGIAAKPLGPFATRWQAFLDQGAGPLVVIGGGVAGVELALAMRHRAGKPVTIVEQAALLSGVGASTRARLQAALRTSGISVIEGAEVTEITATSVRLANDATIPSDFTLGAAGARPYDWLKDTGLDLTDGYVTVGPTLQSKSDPSIFATGDCAHLSHAPRPKAGVFAVRAAPVLTHNLAAAAAGRPLKPFNPQSQYLKLISLGPKRAVADKWDRSVAGDWVWRWKDRIDRKFMHRLDTLPEMPRPETPEPAAEGVKDAMGDKPLCAGCGAKIGPDTLTRVLAKLPASTRKDVEIAAGDDAAILRMGRQKQVLTTDHLRAFWDDPYVFGRIAALHAMGDIWAMGAELQAALVEVTLAMRWPTPARRSPRRVAGRRASGIPRIEAAKKDRRSSPLDVLHAASRTEATFAQYPDSGPARSPWAPPGPRHATSARTAMTAPRARARASGSGCPGPAVTVETALRSKATVSPSDTGQISGGAEIQSDAAAEFVSARNVQRGPGREAPRTRTQSSCGRTPSDPRETDVSASTRSFPPRTSPHPAASDNTARRNAAVGDRPRSVRAAAATKEPIPAATTPNGTTRGIAAASPAA